MFTVWTVHLKSHWMDHLYSAIYIWTSNHPVILQFTFIISDFALYSQPQHGDCEVAMMCQEVVNAGKEINSTVKRVRRRMPQDGSVGPLSYPQEVQDTLTAATTHTNNAARAMRHLTRSLLQQTSLLTGVSTFHTFFLVICNSSELFIQYSLNFGNLNFHVCVYLWIIWIFLSRNPIDNYRCFWGFMGNYGASCYIPVTPLTYPTLHHTITTLL